jgi:hypothetical protein
VGVAAGAGEVPDPLLVKEVTAAVTSLPDGETSLHFAPNPSLPCPLAIPGPESPEKKYSGCPS